MTNQLEHVCVSERDRKRELEVLIMINYHHYTVSNILVILHNFFSETILAISLRFDMKFDVSAHKSIYSAWFSW